MPWTCPACNTTIHYTDYDRVLRPNAPYRCLGCGHELVVDKTTDKLLVAPPKPDKPPSKKP